MKKENESFKRQIIFYKDKLRLELSNKKNFPLNGQNFSPSRTTTFRARTVRPGPGPGPGIQKTPRMKMEEEAGVSENKEDKEVENIKVSRHKKRIVSASCEHIEKEELSNSVSQIGENGIVMSARTKRKISSMDGNSINNGTITPFRFKQHPQKVFNKPKKFVEKFITGKKTKSPKKVNLNSSMMEPKLNLSKLIGEIDKTESTMMNQVDKEDDGDLGSFAHILQDNLEDELLYLEQEEKTLNLIRSTLVQEISLNSKKTFDINGMTENKNTTTEVKSGNTVITSQNENMKSNQVVRNGIKNKKTSSSSMKK